MNTTIKLPSGQTAVMLVPQDSKELAIVHLPTLQRLTSYLPLAPFKGNGGIRDKFIRKIMDAPNLKEFVEMLDNEVSFHKTVNLIEQYKPDDLNIAEKAALVGNDISAGIAEANKALEEPLDA